MTVSFKGPGYAADAFVDRKTATYEITETRMGLVAIVNDLHKGRDTGAVWAQVIDLSAVLMMLVSVTGLTLIFFLHKRLALGTVDAGHRHGCLCSGVCVVRILRGLEPHPVRPEPGPVLAWL